jgi:SPP1 gp7 family putative phage head morphogenesis protein
VKHRPNPLRMDPTRTTTLRRMFSARVKKGFKRLIAAIKKLIVEEDALGKRQRQPLILNVYMTNNVGRWEFRTDPEKVKLFRDWLKKEINQNVTGTTEEQLWNKYITDGFRKGAGRAFNDTRKAQKSSAITDEASAYYSGQKDQFLSSAFGQPVAKEKVELLVGRAFTELEGVTDSMATSMTRTLADGLVQGKSPLVIAKDLERNVERLGAGRAETIARTEIIRAHAEGQLFAMEQMGVDKVGVQVEWSTAGDDMVCDQCNSLESEIMPISEARGMIPLHPRCRCSWIPSI